MAATAKTQIPRNLEALREAYLATFGAFATDKDELATNLGIKPDAALRLLKRLEQAGLVTSVDVNDESQGSSRRGQYKTLTWQCLETYDSIDERQARHLFDLAFGVVVDAPADVPDAGGPDEHDAAMEAATTDAPELEIEQAVPAAVTMVAKPDGKSAWHVMSAKQMGRTLCGLDFTPGNWHREDDVDARTIRLKNRMVCVNCIDRLAAQQRTARPTVPAGEGYHGATADQAKRYLDLHPTGVLAVWIPSDAGTDDIPAAWRVRKDDYGFWLDRKTIANDLDNWGTANQMRQSEVKGLLAQLRERNGGAAAFADNDQEGGTKMATATRKSAARKSAANKKSTTSRRGSMTETAAKADAGAEVKAVVKSLTDSLKTKVKGVRAEPSGARVYYRTDDGTLGFARLGSRKAAVVVGKEARQELTAANVEKFASKLAARAEKLAKDAA